jgi:hypothetical protein
METDDDDAVSFDEANPQQPAISELCGEHPDELGVGWPAGLAVPQVIRREVDELLDDVPPATTEDLRPHDLRRTVRRTRGRREPLARRDSGMRGVQLQTAFCPKSMHMNVMRPPEFAKPAQINRATRAPSAESSCTTPTQSCRPPAPRPPPPVPRPATGVRAVGYKPSLAVQGRT